MKSIKKALLILFIIIIIGFVYAFYQYNKTNQSLQNQKADYAVIYTELINEFETNEEKSNEKYLDKIIEFDCVISEVHKENGNINVSIKGNDLTGIDCTFEKNSNYNLIKAKEGKHVKIKGKCAGLLLDIVFVDCVIVN